MYEGPLENMKHLYLYGSVTKIYETCIKYWMHLDR